MMTLCAGCCIWRRSGSSGTGTRGAKIGIWCSVSWRSCSLTGRQNDPYCQCARTNGAAFTPHAARIPLHPPGLVPAKGSFPRSALRSQRLFLTFVELRLHKIFCHARTLLGAQRVQPGLHLPFVAVQTWRIGNDAVVIHSGL